MEMNATVAERRIEAALKHNAPQSLDDVYDVGHGLMIQREKEIEWAGPHKVAKVDDKIILVKNNRGILQPFHKQQTKPYVQNPVDPSEFFQLSMQPFQSGNNIPSLLFTLLKQFNLLIQLQKTLDLMLLEKKNFKIYGTLGNSN